MQLPKTYLPTTKEAWVLPCKSDGAHFQRWASLVAQMVKNLPAMRDTWVQSQGWEAPLEESMATHASILAQIIPWTEAPGGLQSMGSQRVGYN